MENLVEEVNEEKIKEKTANNEDILNSLKTTGHFLSSWLATSLGERKLPEARNRKKQNSGLDSRIRTYNPLIRNQVFYPVELAALNYL